MGGWSSKQEVSDQYNYIYQLINDDYSIVKTSLSLEYLYKCAKDIFSDCEQHLDALKRCLANGDGKHNCLTGIDHIALYCIQKWDKSL